MGSAVPPFPTKSDFLFCPAVTLAPLVASGLRVAGEAATLGVAFPAALGVTDTAAFKEKTAFEAVGVLAAFVEAGVAFLLGVVGLAATLGVEGEPTSLAEAGVTAGLADCCWVGFLPNVA